MRALLDVSFLLAAFDANHASHWAARQWLESNIQHGWSSCALTQNGFVRIISQPRYPNRLPPEIAIERMGRACGSPHHVFRPCDITVADDTLVNRRAILGPSQVTDAYLLALAVRHEDRLVTLDRRIALAAVKGATSDHLAVV